MRILAAILLSLAIAAPASAEWREAVSPHFVVYANDSEKDIRKFAERLEKFHSALVFLTETNMPTPSPSGQVTIYVVGSDRKVKQLHGGNSRYIGGFYIPRAGGSLAIVPDVKTVGRETDHSMLTLLHEYAHHFMAMGSTFPMPRWMNEGGAEFYASVSFENDGSIWVGRPAQHRAYELLQMPEVPLIELLDEKAYRDKKRKGYDFYYGRAWLLYHYLTFSEPRRGQILDYFTALAGGTPSIEAAQEVFGDFDQLEKELDAYLKAPRLFSFDLKPEWLTVGSVATRTLGKGEAEMMPIVIRSAIGVDDEEAKELLVDARAVAALYPSDPFVQAALAEAEYDAGNDAEAIAAADAALAADRTRVKAYVQKGLALFRLADDADYEQQDAAYKRAMTPFFALNKLDNDHPLPLVYYYQSFMWKGEEAPQLAIDGLSRAAEIAPFDLGLRMQLATAFLQRGEIENARRHLRPVAYHPHESEISRTAQRLLERLDRSSEPVTGEEMAELFSAADEQGQGTPEQDEPEQSSPGQDEPQQDGAEGQPGAD